MREAHHVLAGVRAERRAQIELTAWHAWTTARLVKTDRKHFPKRPTDLIPREREKPDPQGWQSQKAVAHMWVAASGGNIRIH